VKVCMKNPARESRAGVIFMVGAPAVEKKVLLV
jgi:hypothetical protein